ncbi:antibiotic biosynthesis monooxygenase [Enterovibrio norvegicus]|uniref:putative quinol monooxygenase n=1 Tax=Enterovibrio norvegicus TaxID=188144 RepID=UPI003D0F638C
MTKLTIVADIVANEDSVEFVKEELLKLIEITRGEEGCLQYDLHQDNDNPAHFLFFENWVSRELWQDHMSGQHLADYLEATDGKVASFVVSKMSVIG